MSGTGSLLIAIPTYNERDNVGALLPALLARYPDANVVVIDDNSPDGTGTSSPRSPGATGGSTSFGAIESAGSAVRIARRSRGRSSASTPASS
jgi:dolichol-phosphate mannosyltransferase